jgi:hypothetical protein
VNTYSWSVQLLKVLPSEAGLTDVVKKVHATLEADNGLGKTCSQLLVTALGPPDPENFIAYESVTEEDVIGWVEDVLGVDAVNAWKAELDARMYELCELQEFQDPDLPWAVT